MKTTLYGIKNCDTVKKARRWLEAHHIEYRFHDVREYGLTKSHLQKWLKTIGWETLVNKRSTTWKQLDEAIKQKFNKDLAIKTMLEQPTLIKRPVLEYKNHVYVGFSENTYSEIF